MCYGTAHSPGNQHLDTLTNLLSTQVQTNDTCDAQGHEG